MVNLNLANVDSSAERSIRRNNSAKISVIGFFLVFALFGLVANFPYLSLKYFNGRGIETQAVITDIDSRSYYSSGKRHTDHDVFIQYVVEISPGNDVVYDGELNQYVSGMHVGDSVTILYDRDDPTNIASNIMIGWIFIILGILGAILSLFLIPKKRHSSL